MRAGARAGLAANAATVAADDITHIGQPMQLPSLFAVAELKHVEQVVCKLHIETDAVVAHRDAPYALKLLRKLISMRGPAAAVANI